MHLVSKLRIALVHDDLVQWGGAERVLLGLSEIYPAAPIYTSLFDSTNNTLLRNFGTKNIVTSFLQKIPGWRSLYKTFLPFYPIAFEQFDFSDFDLVISHTTRFAKSIITKPKTKHICYLHTPPRFLWRFSGQKNYGLAEILLTKLRIHDQISARRVDFFLAGSENAKKRIKKIYRMPSEVVYPFIDLDRFKNIAAFNGGYFLVVGRPNDYKRFDLAKEACRRVGVPLKIVSGGMSEQKVIQVMAGCRALIIPGIEDFGLTSLEAQALGKPVVAFREGGVLETVIAGKTGLFFSEHAVDSLVVALNKLDSTRINMKDCLENAARFSKERFMENFQQTVASLLYTN